MSSKKADELSMAATADNHHSVCANRDDQTAPSNALSVTAPNQAHPVAVAADSAQSPAIAPDADLTADASTDSQSPKEVGGRKGLDPVRYGDWEKGGRCIDF